MRNYSIEVKNEKKEIYPAQLKVDEVSPSGKRISLTNYYLEMDGEPFFGISGEFHFSRYNSNRWDDEIIKMKMAGINIISTYIFWNHHEEEQGVFDWGGNKDLRHFIELCGQHGMYVIIRIGPFAHGEARNGGLPDWLFGRPFDLRSNDEAYLNYVKNLFSEIGKQVKGLLFQDGGPIIGTQLENEYEHAGAPWEMTTGTGNEWLQAGRDGDEHIRKLKGIASDVGIQTPLYTCTGWGGASAPEEEVLPLWGGYAFWPWIFYGDVEEHPPTPEYIFRDFHNNKKVDYGFTPNYEAESLPFACCEMGGGMTVFYKYRFALPFESVDAMASIKVAGGCNFVGYYVFHGGSNPMGKKTPFLNETATPKISYDYQAPIGEFGQIRDSYKRLKRQHYFYKEQEKTFNKMKTVLPVNADTIEPTDINTLRYALRTDGESGFIFINNYQDHMETKDQENFSITVELENEQIRVPNRGGLSLGKNESCILPFNLDLGDCTLTYATTQFMTSLEYNGEPYYYFFAPEGMYPHYSFSNRGIEAVQVEAGMTETEGDQLLVSLNEKDCNMIDIKLKDGKVIHICTLSSQESMNFWKFTIKGKDRVMITDAALLVDDKRVRLETVDQSRVTLNVFPKWKDGEVVLQGCAVKKRKSEGHFQQYELNVNVHNKEDLAVRKVSDAKAEIQMSAEVFRGVKELLLEVDYDGDIGYAFIDGELIHDNFSNGRSWEIGLMAHQAKLIEKGMYLYISPLKEGSYVKSDSPRAARSEVAGKEIADIKSIKVKSVRECSLLFSD
ncbi:hypothetical protein J2S74_000563 [Evansella vedderi]|uniref:Beta-galactosidase n=1 Tax=Evansella vedderi TaxID=38282 RepID=A0ABT9ZPM2_9BACI|nr:beta-galactosidase [Evansella vedderi]MDQ0253191.1 hypothetical protein [Evansella vedderi]